MSEVVKSENHDHFLVEDNVVWECYKTKRALRYRSVAAVLFSDKDPLDLNDVKEINKKLSRSPAIVSKTAPIAITCSFDPPPSYPDGLIIIGGTNSPNVYRGLDQNFVFIDDHDDKPIEMVLINGKFQVPKK